MQAVLTHFSVRYDRHKLRLLIFPSVLAIFTCIVLGKYLTGIATNLLFGFVAVAATIGQQRIVTNGRFAYFSLLMLLLTYLVPVKTLLYLAVVMSVFFWAELYVGAVHLFSVVAVLLSSPAFHYTTSVFSFPIRLQLTKWVGSLFSLFGSDVHFTGSVISYHGQEFSVDPACMGLHMFTLSMLFGIILIGLLQRKAGKQLGWKTSVIYLLTVFVLNIIANVIRMVILVQFAIPPEAFMHDMIGLLCLFIYVCFPAFWVAKFFVKRAKANEQPAKRTRLRFALQWQLLLSIGLFLLAWRVAAVDTYAVFLSQYKQNIKGFQSSVYEPGIVKLESPGALIYLKFVRGFYDTEHNPGLCWRGSGYEFQDTKAEVINGYQVYTAMLNKGNDHLYTAWWYANGENATCSQLDWRLDMLKGGSGYALVNVTASSKKSLQEQAGKLLRENTLQPFFQRK
jgi:exosortase N